MLNKELILPDMIKYKALNNPIIVMTKLIILFLRIFPKASIWSANKKR